MTAPERIWASADLRREDQGSWWNSDPGGDAMEYVRADLAAAAPDLLAAARDAQTSLSSIASGGDWGAIEEIIDALAAALAKAEGKP